MWRVETKASAEEDAGSKRNLKYCPPPAEYVMSPFGGSAYSGSEPFTI